MNLPHYLRQLLAVAPAVADQVGDGKRIYADLLPQRPAFPALLLQEVDQKEDQALDGPTGVSTRVIEITAWGGEIEEPARAAARKLGKAVKDALEQHTGAAAGFEVQGVFLESARSDFEPETRSWFWAQTWHVVVSGVES
jgi:hypothetical protein